MLRNHAEFAKPHVDGDVDILCTNLQRFASSANITQRSRKLYKGVAKISGKNVKFDIRFLGDAYLPERWQLKIIQDRVAAGPWYAPDSLDLYFSIMFHVCLHKSEMPAKYLQILRDLEAKLDVSWKDKGYATRQAYIPIVKGFLKSHNYFYQPPLDGGVQLEEDALSQLPKASDFEKPTLRQKILRRIWR